MADVTWQPVTVQLSALVPWARNPKTISKAHANRLLDLWQRIGQFQTIAIGPAGEVYDGHQRLSVLKAAHGARFEVQALQSDRALTEKEREELTVAAHVGTTGQFDWEELSGWDVDELQSWGFDAELLRDWNTGTAALATMLESSQDAPPDDPGPQIDRADELREKWGVESGQLWQLGEHRVICGDCTDAGVVARVMGGEKADFIVTSPPYNVGVQYDGHDDTQVEWSEYEQFLRAVLCVTIPLLSDGRAMAWNIGTSPKTHHVRQHLLIEEYGLTYYRQMVWKKVGVPVPLWFNTVKNPVARQFTPNYTHEIVLIFVNGVLKRGDKVDIDPLCENDVFEYGQQFATTDIPSGKTRTGAQSNLDRRSMKAHPAAFPVRIPAMFISHLTAFGEFVYDPFLGSGTTLVACERLNRRCRGVEISPAYVAVTLQRWADMTGQTPVMVTDEHPRAS